MWLSAAHHISFLLNWFSDKCRFPFLILLFYYKGPSPQKLKKELCVSFLKVKTVSAMHFFFVVKKGYANAKIPPIFFIAYFAPNFFFCGRFLTFFPLVGKKRWKKNPKISQKPVNLDFSKLCVIACGKLRQTIFFFGLKSPHVIQRSVSQENDHEKSRNPSPFVYKNYRLKYFFFSWKLFPFFLVAKFDWIQGNSTLWPMGKVHPVLSP